MSVTSASSIESDHAYADFERLIAERVSVAKGPLFTTNASGLWEEYLGGIPGETRMTLPDPVVRPEWAVAEHSGQRKFYDCRCCRRFIEKYGGLVVIGPEGRIHPVLTQKLAEPPELFQRSILGLHDRIVVAKVTGVFLSSEPVWGTPRSVAGPGSRCAGTRWTHLHGNNPSVLMSPLQSAEQAMAEKLQDYITLKRGLTDYSLEAAVQAVRVLEADAVDRSEKTLGVAQWLLKLHQTIAEKRGSVRDNLIWLAVATAPPGWCHIRSTMISTLLDDIVSGLPFESIRRRWNEKMHPLQYQRPSTVKQGNLEQANRIVAKLQSEGSLQRRFARLDEVTALWRPRTVGGRIIDGLEEFSGSLKKGPFDHLKKQPTIKPVELPPKEMQWERFRDTILVGTVSLEVQISHGNLPFFGMVTATNPESSPILQWDGLNECINPGEHLDPVYVPLPRNPVSWYFYNGGGPAAHWGLTPGWIKVNAVCLKPCHWQREFPHQGGGIFFVLEGARDQRAGQGIGLFPETLRSEYHGIRHAIEAFSRNAELTGREEASANGIAIEDNARLTVRSNGQVYTLTA